VEKNRIMVLTPRVFPREELNVQFKGGEEVKAQSTIILSQDLQFSPGEQKLILKKNHQK
jgi:hypothetical protein